MYFCCTLLAESSLLVIIKLYLEVYSYFTIIPYKYVIFKELGLDAIHDTVHEMARDEARHGKAFKGLLERYFG